MTSFIKKRFVLIIILLALLLVPYYLFNRRTHTNAAKNNSDSVKVGYKNLKQTLTLSGHIAAQETVVLRFAQSGKLTWLGIKEGDTVEKNQLIATLDYRDVKKNLEKKLNSYVSERWDFEQLHDDKNVDGRKLQDLILTDAEKRILEKAQFDLDNAVLDVEIQNLALELSRLTSPISGIVTHMDIKFPGVYVTPAGAEFIIINPSSIYVSVAADQSEVIQLRTGMTAEIMMDAYPDQKVSGVIDSVSFAPMDGESTTVYEAKIKLPTINDDFKYRIDMTADVSFVTKSKNHVLSIPSTFIKQEDEKKYVLRQRGNEREKVYVTLGEEYDDDTQILKGVSVGDVVYD